mmetsp:Transcript_23151/g.69610  ORF Transcript_23151/g.69610 Transcript_23151/m.69610 type:complete len:366 (+) Transcript_23151:80-1177(+)
MDGVEGVPTLDVSPYVRWRAQHAAYVEGEVLSDDAAKVVEGWGRAFGVYGFAQVVGHGVDDDAIEAAHGLSKQFFEKTSEEQRQRFADSVLDDRGRGYKAKGVVNVAASGVSADGALSVARPADYATEYIALCDGRDPDLSDLVPGLNAAVERYFAGMLACNRCFMELTALALGMERDHFADAFAGASWLNRLRCAYYPSQKGAAPTEGQLRYGEHTDWQAFTLLWQDHGRTQCADAVVDPPPGGLQVEVGCDAAVFASAPPERRGTRQNTVFVDCPPRPRALTVNAGDQIEVWTNGRFRSCVHRVANPPPGSDSARLSLVLFTGPRPETSLAPLPSCVSADRPAKFAATTSGAHLLAKIAASEA